MDVIFLWSQAKKPPTFDSLIDGTHWEVFSLSRQVYGTSINGEPFDSSAPLWDGPMKMDGRYEGEIS